jgi:alkaline phosphatase D
MRSPLSPLTLLSTALLCHAWLVAQIALPPGMYADSTHAPFLHGVASGDPVPNGMVLWTRLSTDSPEENVFWELAEDSLMLAVVQSGTASARAEQDWTVQISAEGLEPGRFYYYRFRDNEGRSSVVGRTRTAPAGGELLRLAVMSCSSVYSGYFNAYRHLARRSDLNAFLHLGDYLYDFVDPDEQVRVPDPFPTGPQNLAEWRERHAYYLFDPDLRALRAAHPMIALWDNHDLERGDPLALQESVQAFREWVPLQPLAPGTPAERIYRRVSLGPLADLHLMDILLHRDEDLLPGGSFSLLGTEQYNWLEGSLSASEGRWQLLGNQKMVSPWSVVGAPAGVGFGEGDVLDNNSWDGYGESREQLLQLLAETHPGATLLLSGDIHLTVVADLPLDPFDSLAYDPASGSGSLSAEFLPSSISRGNADEMGFPPFLIELLKTFSLERNPHHRHLDLTQHGFGLLTIRPDSIVAESWYAPILYPSDSLGFGGGWVLRHGIGHWERQTRSLPLGQAGPDAIRNHVLWISSAYPNPASQQVAVQARSALRQEVGLTLLQLSSGRVEQTRREWLASGELRNLVFDLRGLEPGAYLLRIQGEGAPISRSFQLH